MIPSAMPSEEAARMLPIPHASLAEHLGWYSRCFRFRRQLKTLPKLIREFRYANKVDERLLALLEAHVRSPGQIIPSTPCLVALTNHRLIVLEPFSSSRIHVWHGESQIRGFKHLESQATIYVYLVADDEAPSSAASFELLYEPRWVSRACSLVLWGRILCEKECWGASDERIAEATFEFAGKPLSD